MEIDILIVERILLITLFQMQQNCILLFDYSETPVHHSVHSILLSISRERIYFTLIAKLRIQNDSKSHRIKRMKNRNHSEW